MTALQTEDDSETCIQKSVQRILSHLSCLSFSDSLVPLTDSVLRSDHNSWLSATTTTTQEISVCVCVSASRPVSHGPLRRKEALSCSISDLSGSSGTAQNGGRDWLDSSYI